MYTIGELLMLLHNNNQINQICGIIVHELEEFRDEAPTDSNEYFGV